MKKKTNLFCLILCLFALLCSSLSVYGLIQAQNITPELSDAGKEEISEQADLMYAYIATHADPEFSLLTFPKTVSEETRSQIENVLENSMYNAYLSLRNDTNFYYLAKKDGKEIEESEVFPKNAKWTELNVLKESRTYSAIENAIVWQLGSAYSSDSLGYTINQPKGIDFEYGIRSPLIFNNRYICSFTNSEDQVVPFLLIAFLLPLFVFGLFVLLFPYDEEKNAPVLRKVLRWKFGPTVLFFGAAIGLLASALVMLTITTITQDFYTIFETIKGIKPLSYALYFILWGMMYSIYPIVLVYIKRIFAEGFLRFIKEDTLLFCFIHWVQNKIHAFMNMDLFDLDHKKTVVALIVIFLVLTLLCNIPFLGWLALVFLFFYGLMEANKRYGSIKQEYQITLNATKKLAEGKFDEVLPYPVGSFQPIYNSLLQIKTGFEKALEEGIRSQDMKTELISNVSHDLKTPLTGIKTYVELLNSTDDLEKMKGYAEKIDGYTDRLDHLVVDLFDVSKANSGNIELEKTTIDLLALIQQVQSDHMEMFEKKGLAIVETVPDHPVLLDLDPDKTMRIIENLIVNIEKYALEKTRVFVDVKENENEVIVQYRNTSANPLNFNPDEIVERFVRGDRSRHEIGSGLGLAIVKSFAEIQNGDFKIAIDGDLFKAILTFKKL